MCDGLTRRFGDRVAVDHVSFRIERGETYGLLGPNGAGKTTTISMIAGVLASDAGSVTVAGQPVTVKAGAAKRAIGLVPQDIALHLDLSGRENLRFFGRLQQMPSAQLSRRMAEVLDIVGLADRADDRVSDYSGGMKRRMNIAVGLLHEPQLLILDEPTAGVDPQSRNQILESIDVLGSEGMAVLYTTHYMEEAERLCDRVGIIDQGRLVAEGTRRQLVDQIGAQEQLRIEGTGDLGALAQACTPLDGVRDAVAIDGTVIITADRAGQVLAEVTDAAHRLAVTIISVEVRIPDLEAVFLHLTGKALRD